MTRNVLANLSPWPAFVHEYELPGRQEGEISGWPDYGVLWPHRLLAIELKTSRGSHRLGQVDAYLALARHHHPEKDIDLLNVTPPMDIAPPYSLPERS